MGRKAVRRGIGDVLHLEFEVTRGHADGSFPGLEPGKEMVCGFISTDGE